MAQLVIGDSSMTRRESVMVSHINVTIRIRKRNAESQFRLSLLAIQLALPADHVRFARSTLNFDDVERRPYRNPPNMSIVFVVNQQRMLNVHRDVRKIFYNQFDGMCLGVADNEIIHRTVPLSRKFYGTKRCI